MAATVHRWHATTGNYPTLANWDTAALPGTGGPGLDTAFCDGVSQQAFTTGLDRSADNPLQRFVTDESYRGDIGALGDPLTLEIVSTTDGRARVVHRGTGAFYFAGDIGNFADVYVDSARPVRSAAMTLTGVIRNVFVARGRVDIAATCEVTGTVWSAGPQAEIHIAARSAAESIPIQILCTRGQIYNSRETATDIGNWIIVSGQGRMWQYGNVSSETTIVDTSGGGLHLAPTSAPTGAHYPDLFVNSFLNLKESKWDLIFDNLVIGPEASISGGPLNVSGEFSPLSTNIDMREGYP